ncbi:MAG: DUF1737 domain-containing protein [Gammaproteobacteria bacterium]|nr:DUF1737 domain-containing protein [Gammaproteobacteria bacterium]
MSDRQIKEYTLLTNSNPMQLSIKVNEKIEKGWSPYFGVAVGIAMDQGNNLTTYAQALVKYTD